MGFSANIDLLYDPVFCVAIYTDGASNIYVICVDFGHWLYSQSKVPAFLSQRSGFIIWENL